MNFTIKPYGDSAILIEFEQRISPKIHEQVVNLQAKIKTAAITGVTYFIPAYCSLTIGYNPLLIQFKSIKEQIEDLKNQPSAESLTHKSQLLQIPVCYETPYGLDLKSVARLAKISKEKVIQLHTEKTYRVYMLGFLPGFAYMSSLSKQLFTKRKATPVLRIPAQSVGIAGDQTGIYPSEAPGGWRILGRTPIPVFNPNLSDPFLFKVGDSVQFKAISSQTFQEIETAISKGQFSFKSLASNG